MAIDNCKSSFQELSKIILPKSMTNMWEKITSPVQMSMFAEKGVGKATALKKLVNNDMLLSRRIGLSRFATFNLLITFKGMHRMRVNSTLGRK